MIPAPHEFEVGARVRNTFVASQHKPTRIAGPSDDFPSRVNSSSFFF